jgi:hypothetical protein
MNAVSEAKSLGAVQDMVVRRARLVPGSLFERRVKISP